MPSTPANPYTNYAKIARPEDFYGRERELRDVFSLIQASQPQCVSIVGERRIGKSSLLAMICHPQIRHAYLADPEMCVFVSMDLLEMAGYQEAELWATVAGAIARKTAIHTPRGLQDDAQERSLPVEYERVKSYVERFQKAGKSIILALDEFEVITGNPQCSLDCLARFRALAGTYDLGIVTTTRLELADACHDAELTTSPFFNIFASTVTLGALERDALSQLVVERSSGAGCPLGADLDWVIAMSGGLPYVAQRACYELFEYRNHLHKPAEVSLTMSEYARLEARLDEWLRPFFEAVWKELSVEARAVLARVGKNKAVPDKLEKVATSLRRYALLHESDLFSPLLARFIRDKPRVGRRPLPWKWIGAVSLGLAVLGGVGLYLGLPAFRQVWQYFVGAATILLAAPALVRTLSRALGRGTHEESGTTTEDNDT